MNAPTAFPLAWPADLPRTTSREAGAFRVSLARAVEDLKDSLRLFGADTRRPVSGVVISSNFSLGQSRPSDPGVAVYFEWDGASRCIAVDRFRTIEANVRAIYHILEGRRSEMRYGGLVIVRAAFRGFAALPAPPGWREVLGLQGSPSPEEVEARFRELAREVHPDRGGTNDAMASLTAARSAARVELGARPRDAAG